MASPIQAAAALKSQKFHAPPSMTQIIVHRMSLCVTLVSYGALCSLSLSLSLSET